MSIDEALLALVREVRRVGAGEAVFRGHVSAHSWGGSVRQPSGGPHPEDGVDLSLLPALLGALPGPPRRCAVELQARADDRWQATLCWADDWDSFITPRRVLRETVEPAVPAAPEIPPVDDDLLAKRWAQVREQHDPRPPATPTEIGATEALLGRSLPQPVRALYAVSDGARRRLRDDDDSFGLFGWHDWLSLAELRARWSSDREFGRDPLSPFSRVREQRPGVIARVQVHPGWLPIGLDGGGNALAIDLAPGPNGRLGQLINYGPDFTDGPELVAWSMAALLRGDVPEPPPRREPWLVVDVRGQADQPELAGQLRPAEIVSLFGFDHLDTAQLRACPDVRELRIRSTTIDLEGLAGLPVELLVMLDQRHLDLSPLAGHPTLEEIVVSDLAAGATIDGLDLLATLPRLRHLTLPTMAWVRAAPALRDHPGLLAATFDDAAPLGQTLQVAAAFDRPGRVLADSTLLRTGRLS